MIIFQTYIKGWRLAVRHLKLWGLLYVINFLFALLVSFPVFRFLDTKLSHSMALDKMYEQFDFTVYTDVMNEYGDVVGFLANQGIITSLLFFLVAVFLVGGILNVFHHRSVPFRFAGFWTGGSKFYSRILGLTLLFLLLHIVLAFLFFMLFSALTAGGLDRFHSEAAIYQRVFIVLPIYLLFATIFWMVQDYAKVIMVDRDRSVFKSIGSAIRFIFNNFLATFLLYALNFLVFAGVLYLYWCTPTFNTTMLALLVGQLFLLFRIGTKLVNLGTATMWYDYRTSQTK